MIAARVASLVFASALLSAAACGDVVADVHNDDPGLADDVGLGVDASAALIPVDPLATCPSIRPEENTFCDLVGESCEYGSSPDPRCNATLDCAGSEIDGELSWDSRPPTLCPTYECPKDATVASLDGVACDLPTDDGGAPTAADELVCTVEDGTCACTTGPSGAAAHARVWVCVRPEAGCPTARPLIGQACGGSIQCDYGSCAFKNGVEMLCDQGVWTPQAATCGS